MKKILFSLLITFTVCGFLNINVNADDFTVSFDENYGYGLECDNGTNWVRDGFCSGTVPSGQTLDFPYKSSEMYSKYDEGYLIGWTKTVWNGKPLCQGGDGTITDVTIEKGDKTAEIYGDTVYYACYREEVGGWRYLQEDAEVSKPEGLQDLECGNEFWIDYCNKESDGEYCYGTREGELRKIRRDRIANTFEGANRTCSNATATEEDEGWKYVTINGSDYSCGEAIYVTTCDDDACNYTKILKFDETEKNVNGTIDIDSFKNSSDDAKKACKKLEIEDNQKKCSNKIITKMRKKGSYPLCYDEDTSISEIKDRLEEYYSCDTEAGYYFDETAIKAQGKKDCKNGICTQTYSVSCTKGSKAKPTLSVTSGVVNSSGKGTISVKATANEGKIDSYFVSDTYLVPTDRSSWIKINGNTFTIESSPGIMYIWVRDSKGNISDAVSGAVFDTVNVSTTVKKLELYDSNGNPQTPSRTVAYNSDKVNSSKYVMLSNDLEKDSEVLADGFNPFDMEYKLEVSGPTVSVYATLTSTDSKYVDGYGPRTVNLNYGVNTVLLKIQNKEGKIRTYTILVTRVDDRTSDNTLSKLSTSVGKVDFNSNITDYKIEIPSNTTSVNVDSEIASDKASYVNGYEPGKVEIKGDTTVKLIKVISQTGSTRTYVLTFIKEGKDIIEEKSLQLSDLSIPGVYLPFESDVANYSLSVDYQTDSIDLNSILADDSSKIIVSYKKKSDSEYKVGSSVGLGLDVGENFIEIKIINSKNQESYYRLTIIRKEFGLDISDDTTLKDLKVLNHKIKFSPNKKDYTVRIKQEKSLVITAVPNSNRAEVFIRGNEELTGFSTVRIKVVAENGKYETYSIDIKKDPFNKTIEIASIIVGAVIILMSSCIIVIKKHSKARKEYFEE